VDGVQERRARSGLPGAARRLPRPGARALRADRPRDGPARGLHLRLVAGLGDALPHGPGAQFPLADSRTQAGQPVRRGGSRGALPGRAGEVLRARPSQPGLRRRQAAQGPGVRARTRRRALFPGDVAALGEERIRRLGVRQHHVPDRVVRPARGPLSRQRAAGPARHPAAAGRALEVRGRRQGPRLPRPGPGAPAARRACCRDRARS
jgi:hypothetical protein